MTVESIRDFLERFKAKVSDVTPSQTAEEIARMLRYWHPPFGFIVDDQNLFDLFEDCLTSHHGYIDPMWLDTTCRESRDHLRWHQQPIEAPAPEPEPAPAQPKMEGRDSLGEGATSTEKPLPTVVDAPTEKSTTALERGRDYAYGRFNYDNQLEAFRQQAWRGTPLVNGLLDHGKINTRYAELKDALDKSINTPKQNDSLQRVAEQAQDEARRAGCCTYKEVMRYVNAAIDAAKGKS